MIADSGCKNCTLSEDSKSTKYVTVKVSELLLKYRKYGRKFMKSIRKKVVLGCLAGALAATGLTGCSNKPDGTRVAATVNGEEIPLGVVSFMTRYQQAQTQAMYDMYFGGANADMWDQVADQETGETYGESARDDVLEQVETMYLLREKSKDYDVTLTKKEQKKITEAAEAFIKANTKETLENLGVSQSDIETALEIQTYEKKMYDPMVADVDIIEHGYHAKTHASL